MQFFVLFICLFSAFAGRESVLPLLTEDPEPFAMDFTYPNEKGEQVSLSDYKGKVVYVSFWATWCKPCLQGFEKTAAMRQQMQDVGVVLLNVSLDDSEETWKKTMSRINIPGDHMLAGRDAELMEEYQLYNIPSYYIIDKEGRLAYLSDGYDRDIIGEFRAMVEK